MTLEAKHRQGHEEEHDGNHGRESGQAEAAERAVELLPGLHSGVALIVVGQALVSIWIIGNTNLQSPDARLKALLVMCQFAA
ncbi:hypothetical protein QNM99_17775 [Pseudomonas sp. PCH446]